ncbi:MAG: N-acetylmuramoyl-L-alanine amidase [Burkholderiaceae bacterium]|nr:N-acetylmuramoyl-L-alanine amidase [Burkholderiaceae bacterium]
MANQPRRDLLKGAAATALLVLITTRSAQAAKLLAVRLWPGPDYTRVTLEHDEPLKFSHFMLRDEPPLRLVVDLQGIALTNELKELVGKIDANDPYIARVRIGQYRRDVVRLVIELKGDVTPQVYQVPPVGPYRYRLLFDLYPTNPADPLMALIQSSTAPREPPPEPSEADGGKSTQQPPQAGAAQPSLQTQQAAGLPQQPASAGNPQTQPTTAVTSPPAVSARQQSPAVVQRLVTIAIDPGHGGEDPGATGRRGTHEKAVTLAVARHLAELISKEPNMRVLLTRDGDYFVPLPVRVTKAQQVHADLFVSIHADAWVRSDARGSTVFALSEHGATSAAAAALARHENESDLIGGVNLAKYDPRVRSVALDLLTEDQISHSLRFGGAVLRELERVNQLHHVRVEQAGFAVLKAPDIPSILVETAFISNPDEELRLRDEAYQEQLAQAIFAGIRRYFERNPPPTRNPVG